MFTRLSSPSWRPAGSGALEEARTLGRGDLTQVSLRWSDGTLLTIVPLTEAKDYARTIDLVGAGELMAVRGTVGYARQSMDTERQGTIPSFLRWFESDLEIEVTLTGPHPVSGLLRIAESMRF